MKKAFDIVLVIVAVLVLGFVGISIFAVSIMGKRSSPNDEFQAEQKISDSDLEKGGRLQNNNNGQIQ